jgi:hypothetical protein
VGVAGKLKKLTRKVVPLSVIDDETGEPLTVVIRKVGAGEVTARTGKPLSLLMALRAGDPDETPEQRQQRLIEEMQHNPELKQDSIRYGEQVQRTVVCLGVVSEKIVDKPFVELAEDEIRPEDLADDFPRVYNAILSFSGLPYQSMEVADMTRFPAEPVAEHVLEDGEGTVD